MSNTQIKQQIMSFRVCMADFGEQFRAIREQVTCPFKCLDRDSQEHSFSCKSMKNKRKWLFSDTLGMDLFLEDFC